MEYIYVVLFHKEVNPLCILVYYGLLTLYHFWKIHIDISRNFYSMYGCMLMSIIKQVSGVQ